MADHIILVSIADPFTASVSADRLTAIARRVLEAEAVPPAELSIAITDDETVRALNREYAKEDAVTDVLSFSQREGEEFVSPPGGVPPLGEVIIAYPQAARQTADPSTGHSTKLRTGSGRAAVSADEEIARLLIHGVLHLLGYDHAEAEAERRMRAREEELLRTAGS